MKISEILAFVLVVAGMVRGAVAIHDNAMANSAYRVEATNMEVLAAAGLYYVQGHERSSSDAASLDCTDPLKGATDAPGRTLVDFKYPLDVAGLSVVASCPSPGVFAITVRGPSHEVVADLNNRVHLDFEGFTTEQKWPDPSVLEYRIKSNAGVPSATQVSATATPHHKSDKSH